MITRQLKASHYESLQKNILEKAHMEPLSAGYTLSIAIDGVEYAVRLQPERHYRMAVLQALRIERKEEGPAFELITKGSMLAALLELLVVRAHRQYSLEQIPNN